MTEAISVRMTRSLCALTMAVLFGDEGMLLAGIQISICFV